MNHLRQNGSPEDDRPGIEDEGSMSDIEKQINIMQAEQKATNGHQQQNSNVRPELGSLDHTAETHELSVANEQLYSAGVSPEPGTRGGGSGQVGVDDAYIE